MIKEKRKIKENYYLDIAETVLERSTCLRRKWGAIIVKNDEIVATGYNGAPRGRSNCDDLGYCMRDKLNIPRGERYEMCRSIHSEQNAIISASRKDMIGSTMYLVGQDVSNNEYVQNSMPCMFCKRFIINAGISKIVIRDTQDEFRVIVVEDFITDDDSLHGVFGY